MKVIFGGASGELLEYGFDRIDPVKAETLNISEVIETLKKVRQTGGEFFKFCREFKDKGVLEIQVFLVGEKIRADTAAFQCIYFERNIPKRSGVLCAKFFPLQQAYVAEKQEALVRKSRALSTNGSLMQRAISSSMLGHASV